MARFFLLLALLCAASPVHAEFDPARMLTRPRSSAELRYLERARTALAAAAAPYALPNLHSGLERGAYRHAFVRFLSLTPAGYELWGADADLSSGLKFTIYKPLGSHPEGKSAPWILAITGTETLIDWLNNADLARPQFLGLRKIVELFSRELLDDRELLITGHSLGGALAQAAAHEIQRNRNARGLRRQPITLLTWNGFGARELLERIGAFDPALSKQMHTANYFVRGDLVSRIGEHFGRTFELVAPGYTGEGGAAETLRMHLLGTIQGVVGEGGYALLDAKPEAPPPSGVLAALSSVSWVLASLQGEVHEFRQLWISRWIVKNLAAAKKEDLGDPVTLLAYGYLYNVGITELKRLAGDNDPDKLRDREELERGLGAFRRLKERR